jgi:hypothetical protein
LDDGRDDSEDKSMNGLKTFALTAVAVLCFLAATPKAQAQVSVGIDLGAAPECPYGYYDYAPYDCAPYGYYGPEWFSGGVFVGAGPWFHGPHNFHGHVDKRFDARRGYSGPKPNKGDKPEEGKSFNKIKGFKGNEAHTGHEDKR